MHTHTRGEKSCRAASATSFDFHMLREDRRQSTESYFSNVCWVEFFYDLHQLVCAPLPPIARLTRHTELISSRYLTSYENSSSKKKFLIYRFAGHNLIGISKFWMIRRPLSSHWLFHGNKHVTCWCFMPQAVERPWSLWVFNIQLIVNRRKSLLLNYLRMLKNQNTSSRQSLIFTFKSY